MALPAHLYTYAEQKERNTMQGRFRRAKEWVSDRIDDHRGALNAVGSVAGFAAITALGVVALVHQGQKSDQILRDYNNEAKNPTVLVCKDWLTDSRVVITAAHVKANPKAVALARSQFKCPKPD
jgi:hypothetical protein